MKNILFGLLLIALVVSQSQPLPKFCKGLDCPEFTVVKQIDEDTEIRNYGSQKWATITYELEELSQYDDLVSKAFRQLFNYIAGQNQEGASIPMASPVLNMIVPGQGPACASTLTVGFFVPFEYQQNPIPPTNDEISIQSLEGTFAVRQFGGRVINFPISEFDDLVETLVENNIEFDNNVEYVAGYDSPFTLFNRHNEVWLKVGDSLQ